MALDLADISPEVIDMLNNLSSEPVLIPAAGPDQTLEKGQGVIRVVPPTAGTRTITLPGVMAAKNQSILIMAIGDDTGTITIEEQGDGVIAFADVILTADLDYLLVKNVAGQFWVSEHEVST